MLEACFDPAIKAFIEECLCVEPFEAARRLRRAGVKVYPPRDGPGIPYESFVGSDGRRVPAGRYKGVYAYYFNGDDKVYLGAMRLPVDAPPFTQRRCWDPVSHPIVIREEEAL